VAEVADHILDHCSSLGWRTRGSDVLSEANIQIIPCAKDEQVRTFLYLRLVVANGCQTLLRFRVFHNNDLEGLKTEAGRRCARGG
jgi:hypothetical protein